MAKHQLPHRSSFHFLVKAPRALWRLFIVEESRSGVLPLLAAVFALAWLNSEAFSSYDAFWMQIINIGPLEMPLRTWVNEGLMTFFFLLVALEIKREFIDGELKGFKKAAFPIVGALGGMVVPALLYLLLNPTPPASSGWAVPIATDIAIAAGVLGLLGKRIPRSVRIFLLTLAIVDDIASILIIAVFYSRPTHAFGILAAMAFVIFLVFARSRRGWPFMFAAAGLGIWYSLVTVHVPGTLAGIIVALLVPLTTSRRNASRLQPAEIFEEILLPFTSFVIVPLFVLANAGVSFTAVTIGNDDELLVFGGTLIALAVGKPVGIAASVLFAKALGLIEIPKTITRRHIAGVGCIAGIGFTVALFISDLAFHGQSSLQSAAILGIFGASVISATIGLLVLSRHSS